jgi:hypothetical protein
MRIKRMCKTKAQKNCAQKNAHKKNFAQNKYVIEYNAMLALPYSVTESVSQG